MAKQTKTGGAYQNYQIIKNGDTTGSSEALAKGMANIASTVAQNSKDLYAARKEQLAKFEQNKRDLRAKGQIRTTKAQEMLLSADTAIKGANISGELKTDFTAAFDLKVKEWGINAEIAENKDSTDEEIKQANANIFNAKKSINDLNLTLKKSQEMQVNAIENLANTQSLGPTWSYNSIDVKGVSDNGSTMEGWNAAHANSAGTTMYLKEKEGQFFLGGSGSLMVEGQEESWEYETDINSYNNPAYSTTTKYTPLIPEASQQVVDQMYGKDPKGKSTGKIDSSLIMKDDKGVEVTFLNPDDGIQYTEIRKDTFGANIIQAADVALSKFDAINNIHDKNNILQSMLRITKEDGEKLWNPNPEIAKPAREELQTAIVDKTKGEALASLNLKEIGDKLYKVSDVQPEKPTVTKPSDKEKDAYYWKNNTTNLFATTSLEGDNKRTTAQIMPEVLPVQIGSSFQGGKITNLDWGADSVTVSFSGSSDEEADPDAAGGYTTAIQAQSTPGSVTLSYGSVKQMTTLAESVGGSLKDPRAASVLALQIANNN